MPRPDSPLPGQRPSERPDPGQGGPAGGDAGSRTRIVLRPIGSALPLGFFAFGMGVLLTGLLDLGALPASAGHQVAVLLLTFPAPLELLAAVFAFLARDGAAGTALGVFGASWASTGAMMLLGPPGARSPVAGAYSLALVALLLVLALAARGPKPALSILLLLASARFLATGLFELTGAGTLRTVAGWASTAVVAVSLYGGLALLLEDGRGRLVLPTGRRGRARESFEGDFAAQVTTLEAEAGVRNQL